ncbi:C_GCAxxG_C_C family probable redox protein [Sporobacter termitidis DSM 10068]|uniref:C_GCAxxG_C_C family probable redox protein n=1 Tax=Sporobacter termitidis DSM 10068 TaxID=1123282 RepID=A0A1M5TQ54_9FIRM|nr:C-GCAxxG-C-C family protein [Sporobacter termitidis]SHH52844.1 C_GCAxxG_C_C family probable redox protein [Sporobacter termitidis DSM 10068]
MDKIQEAADTLASGFNCAQSVFSAFSEDYGLPRETALKIAGGLGGGVRCGELCGAVSGGALVVGLHSGQDKPGDIQAKEQCNQETTEFVCKFREKNGSCVCRDLLGMDISVGDNRMKAKELNLFNTVCVGLIKSAVEILEDMGY